MNNTNLKAIKRVTIFVGILSMVILILLIISIIEYVVSKQNEIIIISMFIGLMVTLFSFGSLLNEYKKRKG